MAQLQSTSITGSLIVTGGITGSFSGSIVAPGSTTQVLYNNSGVISADSGFVYSSGNIGIGTSSPSTKLHISAGDGSRALFGPNATWGAYLQVGASTSVISNGVAQVITTNGNLHLDSGTSQQTYINFYSQQNTYINPAGGNVGINTTNPTYKLTVDGNVSFESGKLFTVSNGSGQSLDIWHSAGSGANAWRHIYGGSGTGFGVGVGGYGIYYVGNSNYNQINYPSGNVFFPYNVGIGISSPLSKLQISSGDNTATQLIVGEGASFGAPSIRFQPASTNYMGLGFITGSAVGNEVLDALVIQRTGNVGIGTTTPSYKLDVNGRTIVNQFQYTKAIDYSSGDLNSLITAGFYDGSGMSNAPNTGWFWVTVETYSGDNSWIHQTATSFGSGNTANEVYTRVNIGGTWGSWKQLGNAASISGTTNYIPKFTSGTAIGNSVIYESSNNIGIGTTSPDAKLHISAPSLGTSAGDYSLNSIHYNSNSNAEYLEIKSVREASGNDWTYGGKRIQLRIDSTYMGYMQFNGYGNNAGISFGTGTTGTAPGNVTERMRIDSSGNVGIGTSSPQGKLSVDGGNIYHNYGNAATGYYFYLNHNSSYDGGMLWTRDNSTFDWQINNATSGNLWFYSYGLGAVALTVVKSSGNIGIGTTSPSALLSGTEKVIEISNSNVASLYLDSTSGRKWSVSSISDGSVTFWDLDAVAERMRINSSGNVGINTNSPAQKLDVAGYIQMSGTGNAYAILGGVQASWSGDTQYPTLYSAASDRWIMHINPHISYVQNGTNGYTGTMTGSTIRFASNPSAGTYWDLGVGVNSVGTDKYSLGRAGSSFLAVDNSGNVGIGTSSPGAKLEVNGSFRATTKSFIIDHPTKENKKLQYGVLEGPEHSVYVRGKLTNTNVIQLPDYWHALVHEDSITVNLTAIGKKQDLWVEEITDTYITVASETGDINCFYAVFAERKDVEKLVTEFDK